MKRELVAQLDPKSPISEVFRTLRTNIQFMNTKGKLRSILVTSTLPGEGKSWTASNLAVTFAQAGKKVVIIDADMRKGRVYSIFGVSPKPGLSNYLSGVDWDEGEASNDLNDYLQETDIENLYVIAAGNVPPNPSELLISDQMTELMEKLKEIYDIIIFDGTPSQLVTDSLILTRIVDSTIVVTASKETKKEDLKRVVKNIKNVGGKVAGIVLNKVPIDPKKYEQSYYYGSTSISNTKPKSRAAKRSSKEMYNRASNIIEKKEEPKEEIIEESEENIKEEKVEDIDNKIIELETIKNKTETQNSTDKKEELKEFSKESETTLSNNIKINKEKEEIPLNKTAEILNQINQYLDEEKKKLKEQ